MSEPIPTELTVRHVGDLKSSPRGHSYVEAKVDGGLVAFWGSTGNMSHIDGVRSLEPPFRIICDCIPSNWQQHDLWIHERHDIYLIERIQPAPLEPPAHSPVKALESAPTEDTARTAAYRVLVLFCKKCGHRRELTTHE